MNWLARHCLQRLNRPLYAAPDKPALFVAVGEHAVDHLRRFDQRVWAMSRDDQVRRSINVQVTNHKPTPRGTVGSIGRPTRFSGRSDQLARERFCERNGLVFDLELQVNCYLRSVHGVLENIGFEPPIVEPFAHFNIALASSSASQQTSTENNI